MTKFFTVVLVLFLFQFNAMASQNSIWKNSPKKYTYQKTKWKKPRKKQLQSKPVAVKSKKPSVYKNLVNDPLWSKLSGGVNYRIQSDLLDQKDPKTYNHSWALSLGFTPNKNKTLRLGLSLGTYYQSLASSVVRANKSEKFFKLTDITLNASWAPKPSEQLFANRFKPSFSIWHALPTSERNRFLGVRGTTGLSAAGTITITPKRFMFTTTGSVVHIFHSYESSPVLGEGPMTENITTLSMGPTLLLLKQLSISAMGTFRQIHDQEGQELSKFGNSISINYSQAPFSAQLVYSNSSSPIYGTTNFFFTNEFQQIMSFRLSYRF